jgi:hypothetical protein
LSLPYLFCSKQSPNIFIAKVMKFVFSAKGTNKNRSNKKNANPTDFLSLLPFPHFPSKKGEEESLKIKKESAGKYSDFCLRFCKKQPMKHFIPALKREKRRAAKSEHFTPKTKPISLQTPRTRGDSRAPAP